MRPNRVPGPAAWDTPQVIARGQGALGEVVLRRRSGTGYELIVNGVFLMDTVETSTERLLAEVVLTRHPAPRRLLIGGLGLGCTLAAVLADARPRRVNVVEIEPLLVGWLRAGLVPPAAAALADPRVTVTIADVHDVLRRAAGGGDDGGGDDGGGDDGGGDDGGYDAIVLDVDNGPGFLVHANNADLYQPPALRLAARALRPGGLLVVWCAAPAPPLCSAMAATVGPTEAVVRWVVREGRDVDYHLYVATRTGRSGAS